jgi:hypothetical protein
MIIPIMFALIGVAQAPPTNPLVPALNGKLECTVPDEKRKTCRSLATYRANGDGTYLSTSIVLISPQGPVTIETTSPVMLKSGRVCGTLRNEDFAAAKLRVAGQLLPEAQATPALARVAQAMASVIGKEICAAYVPDGDGFIEKTSVDGVYQASLDQRLTWVGSSDGYSVAP